MPSSQPQFVLQPRRQSRLSSIGFTGPFGWFLFLSSWSVWCQKLGLELVDAHKHSISDRLECALQTEVDVRCS
jgi:hypothetical protein